jgi:hypothetical protein
LTIILPVTLVGGHEYADRAAILDRLAADDGQVFLVYLAVLELHLQMLLRLLGLGQQQRAAGLAVEAVHEQQKIMYARGCPDHLA